MNRRKFLSCAMVPFVPVPVVEVEYIPKITYEVMGNITVESCINIENVFFIGDDILSFRFKDWKDYRYP